MKKSNKKGFTIVELVIVIAVIGILAAVLIPTFSSVVDKANANSAMQEARNALTLVLADQKDGALDTTTVIKVDSYYFTYTGNQLTAATAAVDTTSAAFTAKVGDVTVYLSENDGASDKYDASEGIEYEAIPAEGDNAN